MFRSNQYVTAGSYWEAYYYLKSQKKCNLILVIPAILTGIYTDTGDCYCTDGYKKRIDCSISDTQFSEESNLAVQILQYLENNSSELAKFQPQLFFDTVGSVITKSDLINDTMREVARNLLEKCLNESSELNGLTQTQTNFMNI